MIPAQILNPRLTQFALTPFGRTAALDKNARRIFGITETTPQTFVFYIAMVGTIVGGAFLLAIMLGPHTSLLDAETEAAWINAGYGALNLFAFALIATALAGLAFWQIRRLHDVNRSGLWVLVSLGFWIGRLALPLAAIFGILAVVETFFRESGSTIAILAIAAPLATSAAYEHFVFSPHRQYWQATVTYAPGHPGTNRFGEPPK